MTPTWAQRQEELLRDCPLKSAGMWLRFHLTGSVLELESDLELKKLPPW
jgi:hypothetical protein